VKYIAEAFIQSGVMIARKNHQFVVHNSIEGRHLRFRDMPEESQIAAIVYMSGAGWDMLHDGFEDDLRKKREWYIKEHGKETFGFARLPMKAIKEEIMIRAKAQDDAFESFDEYHAWYLSNGPVEKHPTGSVWPCIMSQFEDELFEDGWHRFHDYVRKGLTIIPVIYFPRPLGSTKNSRKSRY